MEDRLHVRAHGFQRPFHPFQVASWVVFGTDVLVYLTCVFSLIDHDVKVLLAPFYIATVVVLVGATAKATRCNAADPHVQLDDDALQVEEDDSMPYCGICNVPVFPRSKHCRVCGKCVDIFDHHCMWINNCIGRANYRAFFITISSVALMIGTVLATCAYLLISYLTDQDAFQQRLEDTPVLGAIPKETFFGLLVVVSVLNVPLFVLDLQLVLLHVFLMSQGLTTYEYIMNKRDGSGRQQGGGAEGEGSDKYGRRQRLQAAGKAIKTLPRCMDWIVFCQCGRRRRRPAPKGQAAGGLHDEACMSDTSPAAVQMGHPCTGAAATTGASPQKIGCPAKDADDEGTDVGSHAGSDTSAGGAILVTAATPTPDFGPAWRSEENSVASGSATAQAVGGQPTFGAPLSTGSEVPGPVPVLADVAAPDELRSRSPEPDEPPKASWEAGRRYRAPEGMRLREGPDPTSAEVGLLPPGSLLAVWEVCWSRCGVKCAFVSVQDGAARGQQGWVRCVGSPPEASPPGSSAGASVGQPDDEEGVPAKRMPTPPQQDASLEDVQLLESPRALRLPDVLTGEDRPFDESSVLQDKEHPCPTCGCGPVRRCGGHRPAEILCTIGGPPSAVVRASLPAKAPQEAAAAEPAAEPSPRPAKRQHHRAPSRGSLGIDAAVPAAGWPAAPRPQSAPSLRGCERSTE